MKGQRIQKSWIITSGRRLLYIFNVNNITYTNPYFLKKWANPCLVFMYFCLFKQFLQQIHMKNVHPVYGAGIRTYDLQDMSLLP